MGDAGRPRHAAWAQTAKLPGKPVAEQKPAAEQPAASDKPATSPDDKTVDASKPADDGSTPAADAAVPVATLPQQALDIAAQVAAVQNQVAARQQSVAVPADSTAMPAAVIKAASSTPLSTASAQDTPAQQGQAVLAAAVTDTADKTDAASAPAVAAQAALPQQGTPAAVRRPIPTQHHGTTPPTAAKAGTRQDPAALAAGTQPDASTRQALPVADPSAVPAPSPNAAEGIAQHQVAAFSPVEPRAPQAAAASPAFSLGLAGTPVLDVPSPVGSARWGADLGRQSRLIGGDHRRRRTEFGEDGQLLQGATGPPGRLQRQRPDEDQGEEKLHRGLPRVGLHARSSTRHGVDWQTQASSIT